VFQIWLTMEDEPGGRIGHPCCASEFCAAQTIQGLQLEADSSGSKIQFEATEIIRGQIR